MTITNESTPELESRQIRIYIKPKDEKQKEVSITAIADFFTYLQILLYQVCDEVVENETRKTGRYPKFIKEHCDLVLKNVLINSTDATVGLSSPQTILPLPDISETIGEQAISKTRRIFEIVKERDHIYPDLSPEIFDEERRYRILSAIDKMWPEAGSRYEYDIAIGEKTFCQMNPRRKPKIREALEREPIQAEITILGRLIELNLTKKHTCQIETPEGRYDCVYSADLVNLIKENAGEFVTISGDMIKSNTILLKSEFALKKIQTIPITNMIFEDNEKELKKEVRMKMDYNQEIDKYIIENDQLNIFSIDEKLDVAVDDIKRQIGVLYKAYVLENPDNLTDSAIDFRYTLIEIIGN